MKYKSVVSLIFLIIVFTYSFSYFDINKLIASENIVKKNQSITEKKPDFRSIESTEEKKRQFFAFLYPHITNENLEILKARQFLLNILAFDQSEIHDKRYKEQIATIAKRFNYQNNIIDQQDLIPLLRRVDIVPFELALVQAANESAWGTSRFAVQGNNYFGQWCFTKGCGLVPMGRSANKSHEVRVFESTKDSIKSYIKNLNTHHAYKKLRSLREDLRKNKKDISPYILADGLVNYSIKKEAYVNEIKDMLRHNKNYFQELNN